VPKTCPFPGWRTGPTSTTICRLDRTRGKLVSARIDLGYHGPVRQFARFLFVGAGNTLLSFAVYYALTGLGMASVAAAPVAFGVGAVNGYLWNRRWTFAARDSVRARIVYLLVQAAGAGATSLLVFLLSPIDDLGRSGTYLLAVAPVTVCMFVANRLWTFGGCVG
jgi:putative flippase GtrA